MHQPAQHPPFNINSSHEFNALSVEIFHKQYAENKVYRSFVDLLGVRPDDVSAPENIPFLPIEFFKTHKVLCGDAHELSFTSSGTTGHQSTHYVRDVSLYETSFRMAFEQHLGRPEDWCTLCLLPSYMEREGSSLIYMCESLVNSSKDERSGFFLYDHDTLASRLKSTAESNTPTLVIGVSFALLDFAAEHQVSHPNLVVMETGGMKGRREELTREALHEILGKAFGLTNIQSEYGMTELLSQAYSSGKGLFRCPPWMRTYVRDLEDPLSIHPQGRGVLNIIDLANVHSCSFLATQDLGHVHENGEFEILGRVDNSDIRGCNLMVL